MKVKSKKKIVIVSILNLIIVFGLVQSILAWNNAPYGPNSETPDKPKYFNFIDTGSGTFSHSHYSTHDWIADSAFRVLISESPTDWAWLIEDATDKNPKWEHSYSDGNLHYVVRSYISFLFSTQMPDMNPNKANNDRPHKHPQTINLWGQEGEIIGNGDGTGVWVGKWYHQTLHFDATPIGDGAFIFTPKAPSGAASQKAPWYAWKTSQKAVECLTNMEGSENWAKPEAAACWLGVMTHFIADLTSPPHLISKSDNYYSDSFHGWFETRTSTHTLWDENLAGPRGFNSKTNFFNVDLASKGFPDPVVPIPPHIAAVLAAATVITKSYGYVSQDGLFIQKNNPAQEQLVDQSHPNYWEWGESGRERESNNEIISGGLTYKQYYDKVEYILNTAIYYTAAAMKWTINKVKNQLGSQPNCDQWAKIQYKDKFPDEKVPKENPSSLDQSEESKNVQNFYRGLILLSMMAPIMAIAVIPMIVSVVYEKFRTH